MKPKLESKLAHWRRTQAAWDDSDFLASQANAFMKLRWRRLNRRAAAWLAAAKPRGYDLVDVGAGHADFYAHAAAEGALKSYTGVESSRALLPRNSSDPARSFRLLRGQAEKLPLKDAVADALLLKEVLDHCHDPARAMSEALRVLRPGGVLLLTLTNDAAWYKRLLPQRASRIKAGQSDHLYFFDPDQVLALARQAGFGQVQSMDSHYLRLPTAFEQALGRLPEALGSALIAASDAVGELILPGAGGSFWVSAVKPA